MTLTVAQYEQVLFRQYPQKRLAKMFFSKSRLLALIPKADDFDGFDKRISMETSPTSGGSAGFSEAQSSIGPTSHEGFVMTRRQDYSLFRITTEVRRAARSNKGAVVKSTDSQVRGAMNTIARSMSISMFRNGGGARGQIESGGGTDTLTLTSAADMVNFERNMYVQPSTTDGTSGSAIADVEQIGSINRRARTITLASGTWSAVNYAADNYLFRRGDHNAMMQGLDAWIPATDPLAADSFNGVNRSVDADRLSGIRYTATSGTDLTIENALINGCTEVSTLGNGEPDVIVMNSRDFGRFKTQLGNKVVYDKMSAKMPKGNEANLSFDVISLMADHGKVGVIGDRDCPRNVAYALETSSWKLHHLGPCPGYIEGAADGIFDRVYNADAHEARIGSFHNLGCEAPGHNGRFNLTEVLNLS